MENVEVFRGRNSLILSYIAYGMLALFAYEEWLTASTKGFITACAALILVGQLVYFLLQRPRVAIGDDAIAIINPFNEHIIGWHDVDEIEARYSMAIHTIDGDRIYAWAANAPGRYHARKIHPAEVKGMNLGTMIRAGESPRTDSGVATYVARLKLRDFRTRTSHATAGTKRSVRRNVVGICTLAVNLALIVIVSLI